MFGTRVAETILASGPVRPHTQAGHMIASDPIKTTARHLARRGPSTYGVSWVRGGLVATAVGCLIQPHATESAPSPTPSLGQCSARELGSLFCALLRCS